MSQDFGDGSAVIDEASSIAQPVLPGLPGGKALDEAQAQDYVAAGGQVQPVLPADRVVEEGREGDLVLFDDDDVRQAMRQFTSSGGFGPSRNKRIRALREVMMFAIRIATVNLDIRE